MAKDPEDKAVDDDDEPLEEESGSGSADDGEDEANDAAGEADEDAEDEADDAGGEADDEAEADEDDADDEAEEEEAEEESDDDPPPPAEAKPTKKAAGKKATAEKTAGKKAAAKKAAAKKAPGGAKSAAKAGAKTGAKRAPKRAAAARRAREKKGSPTRNIVFFVVLVGGLAAAFGVLGNQGGGASTPRPKWKEGQTVDVELTLVHTDERNLACAMSGDIKGRQCAFASQNEKNSGVEANPKNNDKLLQPYTTVDGQQLMAAGLWKQEALSKDLPRTRFSVKCKYHVEGKTQNAWVQWKTGEGWHPGNGWFTGYVTDCTVSSIQQ